MHVNRAANLNEKVNTDLLVESECKNKTTSHFCSSIHLGFVVEAAFAITRCSTSVYQTSTFQLPIFCCLKICTRATLLKTLNVIHEVRQHFGLTASWTPLNIAAHCPSRLAAPPIPLHPAAPLTVEQTPAWFPDDAREPRQCYGERNRGE